MPRAALLSIHARVQGTGPDTWEDPSLVQLWGPRYSAYVVAARDLAVFSLGRLPDDARGGAGRRISPPAPRLPRRAGCLREAGHALGVHREQPAVRAPTGTVADPVGRGAPAHHLDRAAAGRRPSRRAPRARPPVPARLRSGNARGVRPVGRDRPRGRHAAFDALGESLTPVRTPVGDAWILTRTSRRSAPPADPRHVRAASPERRRLLPPAGSRSGAPGPRPRPPSRALDPSSLARRRPRGRRDRRDVAARGRRLTVQSWRRLSLAEREAVEAEAESMPLPGIDRRITISWDG